VYSAQKLTIKFCIYVIVLFIYMSNSQKGIGMPNILKTYFFMLPVNAKVCTFTFHHALAETFGYCKDIPSSLQTTYEKNLLSILQKFVGVWRGEVLRVADLELAHALASQH
jgi:hypothetical protein